EDRVRRAELFEEIEGQGYVLGSVQHSVAKCERDESLAIITFGDRRPSVRGPGGWRCFGEIRFALVQINIDVVTEKRLDCRSRGVEFGLGDLIVRVGINRRDPLKSREVVSELENNLVVTSGRSLEKSASSAMDFSEARGL